MRIPLGQCAEWVGGKLSGDWNLTITSVSCDSRLCKPGDLFVAVTGPNFDGNDFVNDAISKGAVAALVSSEAALAGNSGIVCYNSIAALGLLATEYCKTRDIVWIAVTGSNGKTTTRELLATILRCRGVVSASSRNYNNNIGVPLSILSVPDAAWAAIIEIGTNAPGEIAELATMVNPKIGIITSIGSSHLQGLMNVDGVAREKSSLLDFLVTGGLAIFPFTIDFQHLLEQRVHTEKRSFSLNGGADIYCSEIICSDKEISFTCWETDFVVPILGRHNAGNVMVAVAAADWLGITPKESSQSLREFHGVAGRIKLREVNNIRIVDDTYNANPDSLAAAVDLISEIPAKRKVAIIGSMGELGQASELLHKESGRRLAAAGLDLLLVVGAEAVAMAESSSTTSARCKVHYFPTLTAALPKLKSLIRPDDLILIKGSRKMKMERIIAKLEHLFVKI